MEGALISNVLKLLKENKDFPNYQAERRIDIFINHFLERLLSDYLKVPIFFSCPEFPLKKPDIVNSSKANNLSTKLDYLCYSKDQIFFIELKTDDKSIKPEQLKIYFDNMDWKICLGSVDRLINEVKNRSKDYQDKYRVLHNKLEPLRMDVFNKPVRIIYLSPLSPRQGESIGNYKIKNLKRFSELDIQLSDSEQKVWDFLSQIKMNVFEVIRES